VCSIPRASANHALEQRGGERDPLVSGAAVLNRQPTAPPFRCAVLGTRAAVPAQNAVPGPPGAPASDSDPGAVRASYDAGSMPATAIDRHCWASKRDRQRIPAVAKQTGSTPSATRCDPPKRHGLDPTWWNVRQLPEPPLLLSYSLPAVPHPALIRLISAVDRA